MKQKESQNLFLMKAEGELLIQLKNGNLLIYNFDYSYKLNIYSEKTFHKLLEIDLYKNFFRQKIIEEKNKINTDKNKSNGDYFFNKFRNSNFSIKEIDDNLILIGKDSFLIEIKLHEKSFYIKEIKQLNDEIVDINELTDKKILIMTENEFFIIKKENNEYIIKEVNKIDNNWKIDLDKRCYKDIKQYFHSYELPKNRIALLSFSIEECYQGDCRIPFSKIFSSHSKIIFIDFSNLKEIKSTETFIQQIAEFMELENEIIIQENNNLHLYDKNSLDLIKIIKIDENYDMFYFPNLFKIFKFDEHNLIGIYLNSYNNDLILYEVINKGQLKKFIIKTNLKFEYRNNGYETSKNVYKHLFILKNKKVLFFYGKKIFIMNLNLN